MTARSAVYRMLPKPLRWMGLCIWLFTAAAGPPQQPPAGDYAGSDACSTCHADIADAFRQSPHAIVETAAKYRWEKRACESCHGPGAKHAETADPSEILNPRKLQPNLSSQSCLKCHLNQPTMAGRILDSHARNQVPCTGCHTVHRTPPLKGTGIASFQPQWHRTEEPRPPERGRVDQRLPSLNQLCITCHSAVWAEFQRPHRHPLPEGAMSCVDCHNPHGTFLPSSLEIFAGNQLTCFRCHSNTRGPFVFEHLPVRTRECSYCHMSHGSVNPKMLIRQEVWLQCVECHSNLPAVAATPKYLGGVPPSFHDLRSPRFRNCTICHVKIHGSNVNRSFMR